MSMGLYDYVRCDFQLPGTPPEFIDHGHLFQTKDLDCGLETHVISEEGLIDIPGFTGHVSFYDSNVVAAGPGVYTTSGEDAQDVEYEATFHDGRLSEIREVSSNCRPALKFEPRPIPDAADTRDWNRRCEELFAGRRIYVLWGGQTAGYWGEVVAESPEKLCVRTKDVEDGCFQKSGELELLFRHGLDRTHFESKSDAVRIRGESKAEWQAGLDEYNQLLESRGTQSEGK